jgi:hypothetical protein
MVFASELILTAGLAALSLLWWIVVPFYLGSYSKGPKSPTAGERLTTLVAGMGLAVAWGLSLAQHAPFIPTLN